MASLDNGMKLKKATYKKGSLRSGEVMYLLWKGKCIFCGITRRATSAIKAAREVIEAITKEEGIEDPFQLTYFSLETHRDFQRKRGNYKFKRLRIRKKDGSIEICSQAPENCPQWILRTFKELIWQ